MKHESIVEARKAAEAAVADMADSPLKTAAFQTILAQLLQRGAHTGNVSGASVSRDAPKTRLALRGAGGTTQRLLGLVGEGFFTEQRSLGDIREGLSERGWHYRLQDIGTPVTRLVRRKVLRRTQTSARGKRIWMYSIY